MAVPRNLNFGTISTSFLLSVIALPVSLAAFAFIYSNDDSFWSEIWMVGVLPTIWVSVSVLLARDAVKRRPWPQIAGSLLLVMPTVLLFILMSTARFSMHQLLTFRPVDFHPHLQPHGLAFIQRFSVCTADASCAARSTARETKTFTLRRVPGGSCSLAVINGGGRDQHQVEAVRVILNGDEVSLRSNGRVQSAPVTLTSENTVTVELTGSNDAFVYVVIFYAGQSRQPNPSHPLPPD
jgi:hypothetical protein